MGKYDSINEYLNSEKTAYEGIPTPPAREDFAASEEPSFQSLASDFHKKSASEIANRGTTFSPKELVDPFTAQDDFRTGFDPTKFDENMASKIGREDWGDTFSKTFDDFNHKFSGAFGEGLNSTGRFFRWAGTLGTFDLQQDNLSMYETYLDDQKNELKNQLFLTPSEKEKFFGKQGFKDVVGNTGFAFGMLAEFAFESVLTLGVGTAISAGVKGAKFAALQGKAIAAGRYADDFLKGKTKLDLAKTWKTFSRQGSGKASTTLQETVEAMGTTLRTEKNKSILQRGATKFFESIPIIGDVGKIAKDVRTVSQAGGSVYQMAKPFAQGTQRMISEISVSAGEATMEAAGKYGELYDKYMSDLGKKGDFTEADIIRAQDIASDAAGTLYKTNMGVLLVMNRLQFGSMFARMAPMGSFTRKFMDGTLAEGVEILGKKGARRAVATQKGVLSGMRNTYRIGQQLGKKEAARYAARATAKGLLRFEGSEGVQELIQEGSGHAVSEYYDAEYFNHDMSFSEAVKKGVKSQNNAQGFKTFVIGAITGYATRPVSGIGGRAVQNLREIKGYYDQVDSSLGKKEKIEAIKKLVAENSSKIKTEAAAGEIDMFLQNKNPMIAEHFKKIGRSLDAVGEKDEAVRENDQFRFSNAQADELVSVVQTAMRTNTLGAIVKEIGLIGENMTAEEFSETFGMDTSYGGQKLEPAQFSQELAKQIEGYGKTYEKLYDEYGSKIMPELFAEGTQERKDAEYSNMALLGAVDILAGQAIKAEDSVKRSEAIRTKLAENGMGQTSEYVFRTLSDLRMVQSEMGAVAERLEALLTLKNDPNTTMTKEDNQNLKDLQEEKDLLSQMSSMFSYMNLDLIENGESPANAERKGSENTTESTYSEMMFIGDAGSIAKLGELSPEEAMKKMKSPRVKNIIRALMKIKERQSSGTSMSSETFDKNFDDIFDLIRLRGRSADFARATDILMKPKNFTTLYSNFYNNIYKFEAASAFYMASSPNAELMDIFQKKATDLFLSNLDNDLFGEMLEGQSPDISVMMREIERLTKEYQDAMAKNPHFQTLEKILVDPAPGISYKDLITQTIKALKADINAYTEALVKPVSEKKEEAPEEVVVAPVEKIPGQAPVKPKKKEVTTTDPTEKATIEYTAAQKSITARTDISDALKEELLTLEKLRFDDKIKSIGDAVDAYVNWHDNESKVLEGLRNYFHQVLKWDYIGYKYADGVMRYGDAFEFPVKFIKGTKAAFDLEVDIMAVIDAKYDALAKGKLLTSDEFSEEELAAFERKMKRQRVDPFGSAALPGGLQLEGWEDRQRDYSSLNYAEALGIDFKGNLDKAREEFLEAIRDNWVISKEVYDQFAKDFVEEKLDEALARGEDFDMQKKLTEVRDLLAEEKKPEEKKTSSDSAKSEGERLREALLSGKLDEFIPDGAEDDAETDDAETDDTEDVDPEPEDSEKPEVFFPNDKYSLHVYTDRSDLVMEGVIVFTSEKHETVKAAAERFNNLTPIVEMFKKVSGITDTGLIAQFVAAQAKFNQAQLKAKGVALTVKSLFNRKPIKALIAKLKKMDNDIKNGDSSSNDPVTPVEPEGDLDAPGSTEGETLPVPDEEKPVDSIQNSSIFDMSSNELVELREKNGILKVEGIEDMVSDLFENC
jgi:hypothetical protein